MKNKKLLFFSAMVVGLIFVLPHFFMSRILDSKGLTYTPIAGKGYDESGYYHPKAAAAFRGDWPVGDFSTFEYKDGPATTAILNPLHIAVFGKLSGSFEGGLIFIDFIFPALIFIVLFMVLRLITGREKISLFFALIFIFSPLFAMNLPPISFYALKELINSILPLYANNSYFSRWEYPEATYLFYALSLYLIYRAVKFGGKKNVFFAGIGTGLIFYTYFYDWVYIFISLGIVLALFLLNRKTREAKIIFQIINIALIVSIFYWLNFFQLHALPQFQDIVARMGVEISHQFRWFSVWKSYLRIIILVLLLWRFARKKYELPVYFISSLLFAYFVAVNIQMVLGFNPQPDHWYRELFLPVALGIVLIFCVIFDKYNIWIYSHERFLARCFGAFVILFLIMQINLKYVYSYENAISNALPANSSAYRWLNQNTAKDSVVGTFSAGTSGEILLFSHNKVFLPNGFVTLASTDEIWVRAMLMNKIFSVAREKFPAIMHANNYYLFTEAYRDTSLDGYFKTGSVNHISEVIKKETDIYNSLNISADSLKLYKLDYLFFGPIESKDGFDPKIKFPTLEKVYSDENVIIYKI